MHGGSCTFFGIVKTPLVRKGEDAKLEKHLREPVYTEMLLQICRDYAGLPDPRTLESAEIRFFYDGLRGELKQHTKPKTKGS